MASGRLRGGAGSGRGASTPPTVLPGEGKKSLRERLPKRAVPYGEYNAALIDGRRLVDALKEIERGNFAFRLPNHEVGLLGKAYDSFNRVAELIESSTAEFERISVAVGKKGITGQRVTLPGAPGGWLARVESVNSLIVDLVQPIDEVSRVIGAVAKGDLSQRMTTEIEGRPLEGQFFQISSTVNTMVDQLNAFASEVTRVAREVGSEGKLGGQAVVTGVSGTWKDLTDNVNMMAANLTAQVRNIAEVTTAVANGDLSKKITVDVKGEILELKNTINTMVDQLNSFASEVTRVAREVGLEGKLGGQAIVKNVGGTWKDLTDNVNMMAANLTGQVRNIAEVTTAVANGDLTKKITVDVSGEILELKNTINTMVDQLNAFASEVTRVAREVGSEGKLGGQAVVRGVGGTWKDLTDNVNMMAANLTNQVRNIAEVTTAVATGDLSKKITVDVKGEILELKNTINTMVDQLNAFASEVTRVAREVGIEGKLGGQAQVQGVGGTWKGLTDNVNMMAANLTSQVRNIAEVTTAVANGDLTKKITVDVSGEILELKNTINTMVDQLNSFASEVTRVAKEVGSEGKLGGQAVVKGVAGTWAGLTDNVNMMAANLTAQVRNIAEVTTAVANGDLSKKITVDVKGEILELKNTVNTMVDQLNAFASEVTRVAREVGSEGKLGAQAVVRGVGGTWKDLTDNVNIMAANLTDQVRNIAKVVTSVANGDLRRKLLVEAKGEIAELADTINAMIDTLATFADQVTSVAREVGVEGKLGGQASVPGAAGTWRDLTENVNQLAANLTTQVRAIADVATAVTEGDLTRSITVEAMGEVAALKDNINQMIANLRETTKKNADQDWLKTNLAKFTGMLQGQRDLITVTKLTLSELAPLVNAQTGGFYLMETVNETPILKLLSSYAYRERKGFATQFHLGESMVGQCALEKERILVTNVPPDHIKITTGLGESTPYNIVVLPILFEGEVKAVIELASFSPYSDIHLAFLDQLTESIGIVLNTLAANMRTEELLKQSQSLAKELTSQQDELRESNARLGKQAASLQQSEELLKKQQEQLRQTNEELEEKARLLEAQKTEVEAKNHQIELARGALQEKAEQLALTSRYKSEFLANMSHELRTPLNSLLILSRMLSDNPDHNLTEKQVEFAKTIYQSGSDLLSLINDILDMSKIESGTVTLDLGHVPFVELGRYVEWSFAAMAEAKGLKFEVDMAPDLPPAIYTDTKRLQQVLKNLVSNAIKFTESGKVDLSINVAKSGWSPDHESLNNADQVLSFAVRDTGIGIMQDKLQLIFEPFQQADMSTSRKYGGTGLGLPISREIARLLGGEIRVESTIGGGSTFTLYLPRTYQPPKAPPPGGKREEPKEVQVPSEPAPETSTAAPAIEDDLEAIQPGDRVALIVEDDLEFAKIVLATARSKGFKGVIATRGDEGLERARKLIPTVMILDVRLPQMDGWAILDRVKHDPTTRHIPVHILSVVDDEARCLKMGAFAYQRKPVTKRGVEHAFDQLIRYLERKTKNLLVVEDNEIERQNLAALIGNHDVIVTAVASAKEALSALKTKQFDCIVIDLGLPDMKGEALIEEIDSSLGHPHAPIIVYTAKTLTDAEEKELKEVAEAVIIKDATSPEELLTETTIALHRDEAEFPEQKKEIIKRVQERDRSLEGRKVLIVDDNLPNIFAVTSILERQKIRTIYAENGQDGIKVLKLNPDVDLILMDIMMPGMDGYETIRAIRQMDEYRTLPIIALTAKAMTGDRDKCIEAGATSYLAKPIDPDKLVSLIRVCLNVEEASGGKDAHAA